MVALITVNRDLNVKFVTDSSSSTLDINQFHSLRLDLIDKLFEMRIPLAGISRVTGISER